MTVEDELAKFLEVVLGIIVSKKMENGKTNRR